MLCSCYYMQWFLSKCFSCLWTTVPFMNANINNIMQCTLQIHVNLIHVREAQWLHVLMSSLPIAYFKCTRKDESSKIDNVLRTWNNSTVYRWGHWIFYICKLITSAVYKKNDLTDPCLNLTLHPSKMTLCALTICVL